MSTVAGNLVVYIRNGGWNYVLGAKIIDGVLRQGFIDNGGWEVADYPDSQVAVEWHCVPDFSSGTHYNDVIDAAQVKYAVEVVNA